MVDHLGELRRSFTVAASGDGWWEIPDELIQGLSASSMGMFMRCPEQFRQRYVLKRKRKPYWTMVLGSANHDTHERTLNEKIVGKEVSPREAVEFFNDEAWPRRVDLEGGMGEIDWKGDPAKQYDAALDQGARMIDGYTTQVIPRLEPETVGESRFDIWVPGVPVPVIGYTDFLLLNGPVLDIKTTAAKTAAIPLIYQLQARVYNLAHKRGVEYHTVPRTKTPTILTALESEALLLPYDERQAQLTEQQILQTAVTINHYFTTYGTDTPWPANFMSDACGWCGYRSGCPYWSTS